MAKLSMELLKQEFSKWSNLKKAIDKVHNGKLTPFGLQMVNAYHLNDKELEEELDHNTALLRLMSKHVQRSEDKL